MSCLIERCEVLGQGLERIGNSEGCQDFLFCPCSRRFVPKVSFGFTGVKLMATSVSFRVTLPLRSRGQVLVAQKPAIRQSVRYLKPKRVRGVRCSSGMDDDNYVQAHVMEAVSMVPSQGQLFMMMCDGNEVEVNHVNPTKGQLLYKSSTPTIFLKMSDDSDLMLPIVVGETAVAMLMKALHDGEKMGRPNQYQILRNIVGALNYEARMVRVTERVLDTYYARIYIGKPGDEELLSVDARPSDAINLAVRCKIPIYVNKDIVTADAVKAVYNPVYHKRMVYGRRAKQQDMFLDSVDDEPDTMAEEITLMKNMIIAVGEERYADAARWRDELMKLRAASEWQLRQVFRVQLKVR
ncbi:hypothetical protein R1sor_010840 [Riccia sorocarpa]|uniref:BFN domain-containing protein n=1 Tax=Riccia sorocarpa TaxID=122646 RepID=A0ABD3I2M0_9MARC